MKKEETRKSIQNKYSMYDVVWYMHDNKVRNSEVDGIIIDKTSITYAFYGSSYERLEDELFSSKKVLLNSL